MLTTGQQVALKDATRALTLGFIDQGQFADLEVMILANQLDQVSKSLREAEGQFNAALDRPISNRKSGYSQPIGVAKNLGSMKSSKGILDSIGGNFSFGTQSKNPTLVIVIIGALGLAAGWVLSKFAGGGKRRRRR